MMMLCGTYLKTTRLPGINQGREQLSVMEYQLAQPRHTVNGTHRPRRRRGGQKQGKTDFKNI
jgi:hypothetical protein